MIWFLMSQLLFPPYMIPIKERIKESNMIWFLMSQLLFPPYMIPIKERIKESNNTIIAQKYKRTIL